MPYKIFPRVKRIVNKILTGKALLRIEQPASQWNLQFEEGKWDFMLATERREALAVIASLCEARSLEHPVAVLDVGCGNGGLAKLLQGNQNITYSGLDISEKAIEIAKKFHSSGEFFVTSAEQPPHFQNKFDVIIFNEILYYVDFKKTFLCYQKFLKQNGVVVIAMYDSWRTALMWLLLKKYFKSAKTVIVRDHVQRGSWVIQWGEYRF